MNGPPVGNWLADQGPQFLQEAVWNGFYARYLFVSVSSDRYHKLRGKGNAVWIAQQGDSYVLVMKPADNQHSSVVHPTSFETDREFDVLWREDYSIASLKRDLEERALGLVQQLNKAFLDVIAQAAVPAFDIGVNSIEGALAEATDLLEKHGWHADRLLVSRQYRNRFVEQGLIAPVNDPLCPAQIGATKTGVLAFAYEDPNDSNLYVFDSHAGLMLGNEPRAWYSDRAARFRVGVKVQLEMAPIVEDSHGVVALSGVERSIASRVSGTVPAHAFGVQYVSAEMIGELRRLQSPAYDVRRLVDLCEELNITYANHCYIAAAALLRTILNHVVPVFGKTDFKDWASQCPGSLGKSMRHLQQAIDIADRHLHVQISGRTALPTSGQLEYRSQLDALLEEIVRLLK